MITDKDRIEFLQRCIDEGEVTCFTFSVSVRTQIDLEMAKTGDWSFPDFHCDCGVGYNEYEDMDDPDGNLPILHSTEIHYHPNGQETWTDTRQCRVCGAKFTFEESN